MKAILVFILLLASIFFLPSSTLARQLEVVTGGTQNPNNPAFKCSRGGSYRPCAPSNSPPRPPCNGYIRSCHIASPPRPPCNQYSREGCLP
ncbi:hypothetical protein AAZX31_08G328600 [Glycine max]|uniref:Uncharacterized protein n=1 Tax=Glycine max TaxID=3847 RepID=C6T131_SOYBN|nr:uncharacterized protein LOC100500233 precursor [Glycine max]KAG5002194.1 hypothetical protein JHK87_023266 [Glycine soja]ACU15237.1 unknown [Glycine max]KAG5017727.1 hypothetical protein JHK85_023863 [Glycine max]KAG5027473.1 hypothetical protein JHK86_023387 [Glycine max]KAH1054420.1 hypothetical protein GYH30_023273 [Glycine max]|eukprot:NP_001235084.1 uncharacterized protein LOC100500233 precursor [Glycine max]